ncbi:zinc ABC transporter substrate-binding protein [SAR202 cluster bacterium AD-804-J14_MRT_500m]|nr:zinc ABC transporter substrate-binding protein [SAR202 cluster bacterium AD-804-J14_MRT_500m]
MYHLSIFPMILFSLLVGTSCTGNKSIDAYGDTQPITVVATNGIIADWASQIADDSVQIFSLVQSGSDPHSFSPSARDIARIADADIVFSIGRGLEDEWLDTLIVNSASKTSRLSILGNVIEPYPEQISERDPHFWLDPTLVDLVINEMATVLSERFPSKASIFMSNAQNYSNEIQDLHQSAKSQFSTIPPDRRLIVATHDSLSYLANRYGFQIIGSISHSTSTHDRPSPQELSDLVQILEKRDISAIFSEFSTTDRLPLRISEETGIPIVQLYLGSFGSSSSNITTYIDLMNFNIKAIAGALK